MTSAGALSRFPLNTETSEEHDGLLVFVCVLRNQCLGVHQIMWIKRPSEIAAVSRSGQPESSFTRRACRQLNDHRRFKRMAQSDGMLALSQLDRRLEMMKGQNLRRQS